MCAMAFLKTCDTDGTVKHNEKCKKALRMQRDRATCHKYKMSYLKKLAIGE